MISCRQVLVRQGLAVRPSLVGRRGECRQDVLVEEVRERSVPHVVEEARDAQRLDDEPLGRDALAGRAQRRAEGGVERPGPEARLVHHAQAVREPAVLGGREDPARALELAHAPQALHPRGVEEVLLGRVLGWQAGVACLGGRRALRQLHVAVDRIADEVDEAEPRRNLRVRHRIATPWAASRAAAPSAPP